MPPPVSVSISAKIAPEQAAQIRELIEAGLYLDKSDFVRDAIRHRLSEIKVIKCRDVDFQTAKKKRFWVIISTEDRRIRTRRREILSLILIG